MDVGKRIKERRKELNMSVDELAQKLNKNRTTVYRYEKGDIENLPMDILGPLAEVLNTTPAYLMGWDNKPISAMDTIDYPLTARIIYELNDFILGPKNLTNTYLQTRSTINSWNMQNF